EEIERHGSTLESEAAKLHGHLSELGPQCLRALAGKGRVIPVKKAFPNEFQPFAHGVGGHAKMAAGESYFFSGNEQEVPQPTRPLNHAYLRLTAPPRGAARA